MTKWTEDFYTVEIFDDHPQKIKDFAQIAKNLGLKLVQGYLDRGEKIGLSGNTFKVKDKLKAAGFRWHAECKVWFTLIADAEAAFARIIA